MFHHMLDTSSKSSPRRCRWISWPLWGTFSDSSLHLRPPTSPDDSVFLHPAWTLRSKLFANLPSESQADLRKEMLRRCFAKRDQSGGACLVLLTKPCVRLADLCQGSMLKIQDQRRSLRDPPLPPTPIVVHRTSLPKLAATLQRESNSGEIFIF